MMIGQLLLCLQNLKKQSLVSRPLKPADAHATFLSDTRALLNLERADKPSYRDEQKPVSRAVKVCLLHS